MKIIDVTADNVVRTGFFCFMSKKKAPGYARKLAWLQARFAEGLRLKMLELPDRGFIEYIPGEQAWRTIDAAGYMVIHCLWVVGKSKGQGFGQALLEACLADAQKSKMKGVAVVTSDKVWMAKKKLFEKNGFACVATADPSFSLMVKSFKKGPLPSFIDTRATIKKEFPQGLTVIRSDQCPYIEDATNMAVQTAQRLGINGRVVELQSAQDVRRYSPSPYGTFGLVLDGELLSYHYLLEKDLSPLLQRR